MYRYWYDEETGEIYYRTLAQGFKKYDLPYFDSATGIDWSFKKVDVSTGKLIDRESPYQKGDLSLDPRRKNIAPSVTATNTAPRNNISAST